MGRGQGANAATQASQGLLFGPGRQGNRRADPERLVQAEIVSYEAAGGSVERTDFGSRQWYYDGQFHREGGPAYEKADGGRGWYRHGQLHREDGPAIIEADGSRCWFLEDLEYPTIASYRRALDKLQRQRS